jgi:hypothetical protein
VDVATGLQGGWAHLRSQTLWFPPAGLTAPGPHGPSCVSGSVASDSVEPKRILDFPDSVIHSADQLTSL